MAAWGYEYSKNNNDNSIDNNNLYLKQRCQGYQTERNYPPPLTTLKKMIN